MLLDHPPPLEGEFVLIEAHRTGLMPLISFPPGSRMPKRLLLLQNQCILLLLPSECTFLSFGVACLSRPKLCNRKLGSLPVKHFVLTIHGLVQRYSDPFLEYQIAASLPAVAALNQNRPPTRQKRVVPNAAGAPTKGPPTVPWVV